MYSGLLVFYMLRRRRKCYDIADDEWKKFTNIGSVLLTGYFLHFLPFVFIGRTLFLHHYLPAFIFKVLLTAATIDHLYYLIRTHYHYKLLLHLLRCSICALVILILYVFKKFAVVSYGTTHLSAKEVLKLRWRDTWDFIVHKT